LLDTLPRPLTGAERARCQHLVLGVVRHFGRIDAALGRLIAHPPRFATRAVLFVAGFELIEAAAEKEFAARTAKIVHHAVEQTKALASPAEAKLVNAVVRKLASRLAGPAPSAADSDASASAAELAEWFSHPEWLVKSWLAQFGPEATRSFLEWNQQPARVYARWRGERVENGTGETPERCEAPPDFLKATRWPDFFEVASGRWADVEPLLQSGKIYLQDPSTRLPVELLAPRPGETVLDLCAAPGGKALLIADTMRAGRLVAVDLPPSEEKSSARGAGGRSRTDRLKENLSRAGGVDVALVFADVLKDLGAALRTHNLPLTYPAVLIDVPCSNTGVMRHRVDVKWRLQPGDFEKHPRQQLSMLHAAARLVAAGGRLVYSTCSIDAEENEHVVREFLASRAGGNFTLAATLLSYPWTSGHDGGAAFLLARRDRLAAAA